MKPCKHKEIQFGKNTILLADVPDFEVWIPRLLQEMNAHRAAFDTSHMINGRWENSYLSVDLVPHIRIPMRFARNLGKEIMKIQSMILFESPTGSNNPHPPFWFNLAKPGEITGLHNHAHYSALSVVTYLQAEMDAGSLYFHLEGEGQIEIEPALGRMVMFPPSLHHGVRVNRSTTERISLAFNLFSFPFNCDKLW